MLLRLFSQQEQACPRGIPGKSNLVAEAGCGHFTSLSLTHCILGLELSGKDLGCVISEACNHLTFWTGKWIQLRGGKKSHKFTDRGQMYGWRIWRRGGSFRDIIENRDAMEKHGWTNLRSGQKEQEAIIGLGWGPRIQQWPFIIPIRWCTNDNYDSDDRWQCWI